MKKVVLIVVVILAFGFSKMKEDNEAFEPVVVLELFTSQGCSSCPSADRLLNTVRKEYKDDNIFVLSYHVTYWNYIGWKDPFSKEKYTDKQREYGQKFRSRSIYTPQLVVNGKEHFVGSNRSLLNSKLKSYSEVSVVNNIRLSDVKKTNDKVSFNYEVKGNLSNKSLRTILVIEERDTFVKRGENRDRKLTNSNIVIAEKEVALKDENGFSSIAIPDIVKPGDKLHLMVVTASKNLSITGAAKKALY